MKAAIPPVEPRPPTITAALATHAGHMIPSPAPPNFSANERLPRARGLIEDVAPALHDALPVFLGDEAEGFVMKFDQRSAGFLAEAVLHVRDNRVGHEQWPGKFEQRRALDGLHVGPEMPIAVAQVAIPPATGPWLDLHGHGVPFRVGAPGADLLEQRGEGDIQGRAHVHFLRNIQNTVLDS